MGWERIEGVVVEHIERNTEYSSFLLFEAVRLIFIIGSILRLLH